MSSHSVDKLNWAAMRRIPKVVTHRYDPTVGICANICSLPDLDASRVLRDLRERFRPTLKPDYLSRRKETELWLAENASNLLSRPVRLPGYFFLGDFSFGIDQSRPSSLLLRLSRLPALATTFTLGDSMTIVAQSNRRLYPLSELTTVLAGHGVMSKVRFTDRSGFQKRFVEIQVWDRSFLSAV